ncbi:MAG: hypothetical protein HYW86_00970 [Candidatus Roizmanbacteria bacterium]|nr:MAG: hypothetical protein HYW86_00970 [Candidatus Roizmanbacteria bacterium]
MKTALREEAIKLRKTGLSYSEIQAKVPVARSTLSLWLRSEGLSIRQKQRLTEKKLMSIRRGWEAWKRQRIDRVNLIKDEARKEIRKINIKNEHLLLMGTMLYWAEGAKEKNINLGKVYVSAIKILS